MLRQSGGEVSIHSFSLLASQHLTSAQYRTAGNRCAPHRHTDKNLTLNNVHITHTDIFTLCCCYTVMCDNDVEHHYTETKQTIFVQQKQNRIQHFVAFCLQTKYKQAV